MPTNKTDRVKIHPILEFEQERNTIGKAEQFLQRIKETKKNVMNMLKQ